MLRRQSGVNGETCARSASLRRGAGVRAPIVALKPGNAGGAKGCRKVEMDRAERRKAPGLVPVWLYLTGEAEAPARSYAEQSFRARQMLMASPVEVAESTVAPLLSTLAAATKLAPCRAPGRQFPRGKPLTGEPDAGNLPVRFGGRGRREPLPTPIIMN